MMSHQHFNRISLPATCIVGAVAIGMTQRAQASQPIGNSDDVRFVVEACQANRERFSHLRCTYHVVSGEALSRGDAIKGILIPRDADAPLDPKGIWIVDGDSIVSREFYAEPMQIVAFDEKTGYGSVRNMNAQWLKDGEFRLTHSPSFRSGRIAGPDEPLEPSESPSWTPFAAGMSADDRRSPYRDILGKLESGAEISVEERGSGDDKRLVIETAGSDRRRYTFAPSKGHLCIGIEDFDAFGAVRTEALVTDIAAFETRFFPKRVVRVDTPGAPDGMERGVVIIECDEVDAAYRAGADDMAISLNAGTTVSSRKLDYASIKLDKDTRVRAVELKDLQERVLARGRAMQQLVGLPANRANSAALGTGAPGGSSRRRWLLGGATFASLGVVAYVVWTASRRQRPVADRLGRSGNGLSGGTTLTSQGE